MAGGGATQQNLRKAIGALKDTTTVGLVKVNSDYKELDVAIVKATNHVEQLPKEKHVRTILESVSASRPRADVAYCINSLARRLAKTHNWAVALKTLIVIHRALREVDASFRGELIKYSRSKELDTIELLEHLPALQQLLFRLLGCQPEGAAMYNSVIHCALSIVVGESIKIYIAINICTLNLVDKFFDMQRHDAIRALEIYRRAGQQAARMSKFYDICKRSDFGRGQKFVKIEQPPASFVAAMEEFVKAASPQLLGYKNVIEPNKRIAGPITKLAIEHKKVDLHDKKPRQPTRPPIQLTHLVPDLPVAESAQSHVPVQEPVTTDLLRLDDFHNHAASLEEKNSPGLAIVTDDYQMNNVDFSDISDGSTGWELALMTASSSDTKLVAPFNKLTFESLYGDQISRTNQNSSCPNPFESAQFTHDPFYASDGIDPLANLQMATMAQEQALIIGRQKQAMGHENNPFGNPFVPTGVSSYPAQDPYTSLM